MNALDPASGGGGEERTEDKPSVAASSSAMEPTKQRSKKDWRIGYFSNAKARKSWKLLLRKGMSGPLSLDCCHRDPHQDKRFRKWMDG